MTTFYLIRHGETQNNLEGRINGCHSQHPLNERGIAQAAALRDHMATRAVDAIYASTLPRARQTAAIVFGQDPDEIPTVFDLREVDFGIWDGKHYALWSPQQLHEWQEILYKEGYEGGENAAQAQQRVCRAFLEFYERHRGQTVALVSHGSLLDLLMMALLDQPRTHDGQRRCEGLRNTAFHCIEIDGDERLTVTDWHHDTHLPDALLLRFGRYTPRAEIEHVLRAPHSLAALRRIANEI